MLFNHLRHINPDNGNALEDLFGITLQRVHVWTTIEDLACPHATKTLSECETLIVDDITGFVYATHTENAMDVGLIVPSLM